MKVLRSTFVFWVFGLSIVFVLVLVKRQKQDELLASMDSTHYFDELKVGACFFEKCVVSKETQFFSFLEIETSALKEAKSIVIDLDATIDAVNGEFHVSYEFRDKNDKNVGSEGVPVLIQGSNVKVSKAFVLNEELLRKSQKLIVYIWNPNMLQITFNGVNTMIKKDLKENALSSLSTSKRNNVLFSGAEIKKYIDILNIYNEEEYKNVNAIKVDVLGLVSADDLGVCDLIFEIRNGNNDVVYFEKHQLIKGISKNSICLKNIIELKEKGGYIKMFLMAEGEFSDQSFEAVNVEFYD